MKKNKGIITLIVTMFIIVALGYVAIWGIGTEKAGAASEIKKGLDLAGGVSITYTTVGDETPSAEDMSDTIYKLQQRVQQYSTEAQVYQEGDNRINIEIPGVSDANKILEELGKPGSLEFTLADGTEVLTGMDVESAEAAVSQDNMKNREYVVELVLTSEGASKFATATSENIGNQNFNCL